VEQALAFVEKYGSAVVFVVIFLDQLGFPVPTIPILLGFGALAGSGRIDPLQSLVVGTIACLCADFAWFELGRWKGTRVLNGLCRISLEPDTCVSKTRDLFARHGVKSLLVAKFVPGFDTVAPPLAGLLGVRIPTFLLWSTGGALLWLLAFAGLGYVFSDSLEALAEAADRLGGTLAVLVAVLTVIYIGRKVYARQRLLHDLRMERITPDELHALIVAGRRPLIVDARTQAAIDEEPFVIEGSLHITLEEIEARLHDLPHEQEIVVYCSCPNEVSSARVALKLKRIGYRRVRPLVGGIGAWRTRDFGVVPFASRGENRREAHALAPVSAQDRG
jgi:membrane protein DedA with SNARE-associated domain/rhodanese-related sulfurtransferase